MPGPYTIATDDFGDSPVIEREQSIFRTSDGKLLVVYFDGTNIVYRTSSDDGVTWSAKTTIFAMATAKWLGIATAQNGDTFYVAASTHFGGNDTRLARIAYSAGSFSVPQTRDVTHVTAFKAGCVSLYFDTTNTLLHLLVNHVSDGLKKLYALNATTLADSYGSTAIRASSVATLAGDASSTFFHISGVADGGDQGLKIERVVAGASSYTIDAVESVFTDDGLPSLDLLAGGVVLSSKLRILAAKEGSAATLRMFTRDSVGSFTEETATTSYSTSGSVQLNGSEIILVWKASGVDKWARRLAAGTWDASASGALGTVSRVASAPISNRYLLEWATTSGSTIKFATTDINRAPSAPSLTGPSNGSYVDFTTSGGRTFSWTHSDPDGDAQLSYAFRRKVSGAGSYEYWNAGSSAWQSGEVFNVTATGSLVFPVSSWSNGNTYNWSVCTADDRATGTYATDRTVVGSLTPSVAVTTPTGSIVDTSRPLVQWTFSDPEGHAQQSYQVKIFSADQYGAGGFDPSTSTTTWDSGSVTSSSLRSQLIGVDLTSGVTYRAYVQCVQIGSQASAWAFSGFTMSLDLPAVPLLSVTADAANARVAITVNGRSNILTVNQASIETDTTGWTADSNCTIARSTAQAHKGTASLSLTATAGADMRARTPEGLSGVPVVVAQQYTALASFRSAVTARSVRTLIRWYDVAGALLSTTTGSSVSDTTSAFTQATVTAAAPASAVYSSVVIEVLAAAAAEVHYVDAISFAPGASTSWTRGGAASAHTFRIEASDNAGATWATVRGNGAITHDAPATQLAAGYDYTPPPNTLRQYRARTVVTV